MARQTPSNVPYSEDNINAIRRASDAVRELTTNADQASRGIHQSGKEIQKTYRNVAVNSAESMDKLYQSMIDNCNRAKDANIDSLNEIFKTSQEVSKKTNETMLVHTRQTHEEIKKGWIHTGDVLTALIVKMTKAQKLTAGLGTVSKSLGGKKLDEHLESINKLAGDEFSSRDLTKLAALGISGKGILGAAGQIGDVVGLVGKIGPVIAEMAPAVTMFSGLAAAIAAVVKELWDVENLKAKMSVSIGGDKNAIEGLVNRMDHLALVAHKDRQELLDMTEVMEQHGLRVIEGGKAMDDYIVTMSQMSRVLGLNNDQLADIVMYQSAAGKTAKDVHDKYDEMYKTMQSLGETLQDFSTAMNEGQTIWKQYSYVGSSALDSVQSDVLKTMGLFKAFNVDLNDTKDLLGNIYGDQKQQSFQAMLIASQEHMSYTKALDMVMNNAPDAAQHSISAQMKAVLRNKSAHFEMTHDQLMGLDEKSRLAIEFKRRNQLDSVAQAFHIKPSELQALVTNYQQFNENHPGASIDTWMGSRKMEAGKAVGGGIDEAKSAIDMSPDELMAQGNRGLVGIIQSIAKDVRDIAHGLTGIMDFFHVRPAHDGQANSQVSQKAPIPSSSYIGTINPNLSPKAAASSLIPPPPSSDFIGSINPHLGNQQPMGLLGAPLGAPMGAQLTQAPTAGAWVPIDKSGHKLASSSADAFARAVKLAAADGVKIQINSAGRTFQEQARLYNKLHGKQAVALPGHSNHEKGNAIDVQNWKAAMPYLAKVGFIHGDRAGHSLYNDPWHFSYHGGGATKIAGPGVGPGGIAPPPNLGHEAEEAAMRAQILAQPLYDPSSLAGAPPGKVLEALADVKEELKKANQHHEAAQADRKQALQAQRRAAASQNPLLAMESDSIHKSMH